VDRQNVVSREYKVMLRPARFTGDRDDLLEHAASLWKDLSRLIRDVAISTAGSLSEVKPPRLISFFDTRDHELNEAGYIFRERLELEGGKREITLKFRHADRFLSQARDMRSSGVAKSKTKFEEDIKAAAKAPFVSLYSFSTTIGVDADSKWPAVRDVVRVFPDVGKRLEGVDPAAALKRVNNFTARELVLRGATARIGKTPDVDAEWALIVWYKDKGPKGKPATAELSYRYGDDNEAYEGGLTRRACDIFSLLQSGFKRWVDPNPRTKTAFVFD
jgi:hypothetical protein